MHRRGSPVNHVFGHLIHTYYDEDEDPSPIIKLTVSNALKIQPSLVGRALLDLADEGVLIGPTKLHKQGAVVLYVDTQIEFDGNAWKYAHEPKKIEVIRRLRRRTFRRYYDIDDKKLPRRIRNEHEKNYPRTPFIWDQIVYYLNYGVKLKSKIEKFGLSQLIAPWKCKCGSFTKPSEKYCSECCKYRLDCEDRQIRIYVCRRCGENLPYDLRKSHTRPLCNSNIIKGILKT